MAEKKLSVNSLYLESLREAYNAALQVTDTAKRAELFAMIARAAAPGTSPPSSSENSSQEEVVPNEVTEEKPSLISEENKRGKKKGKAANTEKVQPEVVSPKSQPDSEQPPLQTPDAADHIAPKKSIEELNEAQTFGEEWTKEAEEYFREELARVQVYVDAWSHIPGFTQDALSGILSYYTDGQATEVTPLNINMILTILDQKAEENSEQ